MDKMILLLFAVFAVFQAQAAPGLYDPFFRDEELRGSLFFTLSLWFLIWAYIEVSVWSN